MATSRSLPDTNKALGAVNGNRSTQPANSHLELKTKLHRFLQEQIDPEKFLGGPHEHARAELSAFLEGVLSRLKPPLLGDAKDRLIHEMIHELSGLGPLEPLLQDPSINDILVNGPHQVYIERFGILEETEVRFKNDGHLRAVIDKIVSAVGRRIDEAVPIIDARLADGSRVNVILPPLSVDGAHLSIRRFGKTPVSEHDLLAKQSLTPHMLSLLKAAVIGRLNILISGGTGAGKTTLLNVLSGYISPKERIVTIEDSAELQLRQRHVVRLECRPGDAQGRGEVQARQLVKNSLRMRPNRIIVGEVRGEEALDMLQALNTGHDGSLTTVHANSPRDALSRIETMAMMANLNLPEKAIRRQIASAITLIVQVARFGDGSRRVTQITEITGMEGDIITLQDLFGFEQQGISSDGNVLGTFSASGIRPVFSERLKLSGIDLPANIFEPQLRRRK